MVRIIMAFILLRDGLILVILLVAVLVLITKHYILITLETTSIHSVVPQITLVTIKRMKIGCLIRSFIDGAEQLRYPLMNWLLMDMVRRQIRKPSLGIYAPGSHKIVACHGATAYSAEMIIGMVLITSAAAVGREKGYPLIIRIVTELRLMLPVEVRGTITCSLTR